MGRESAAIGPLPRSKALERKRQEAVILFPAGQEKATDIITETEARVL